MAFALAMLATASLRDFAAAETLGSFQHTSNRAAEGAPGCISRLAQTADGFLRMAGPKGLVRFDGVQFMPFKPVPGEHLLEARSEYRLRPNL